MLHIFVVGNKTCIRCCVGEGNGTPLQYFCLENLMDRGAWWAAVHGVARVGHDWETSLSLFTFMHWRRKWQPTPVFLPGESQEREASLTAVYGVTQSQTQLKGRSSSKMLCMWIYYIYIYIYIYIFLFFLSLSLPFLLVSWKKGGYVVCLPLCLHLNSFLEKLWHWM